MTCVSVTNKPRGQDEGCHPATDLWKIDRFPFEILVEDNCDNIVL